MWLRGDKDSIIITFQGFKIVVAVFFGTGKTLFNNTERYAK